MKALPPAFLGVEGEASSGCHANGPACLSGVADSRGQKQTAREGGGEKKHNKNERRGKQEPGNASALFLRKIDGVPAGPRRARLSPAGALPRSVPPAWTFDRLAAPFCGSDPWALVCGAPGPDGTLAARNPDRTSEKPLRNGWQALRITTETQTPPNDL